MTVDVTRRKKKVVKALRFTQIAVGETVNRRSGTVMLSGFVLYGLDKKGRVWKKFPQILDECGNNLYNETIPLKLVCDEGDMTA